MGEAARQQAGDLSAHRAAQMLQRAEWAGSVYAGFGRTAVLRIAEAAAEAGAAKAAHYAKLAVEETGFGVVEHKTLKNELCSRGLFAHYRDQDFTGYRIDRQRKILEVARPAGVIFALTPSTNPVCSVFYKVILALLTRNAIVISPHPMPPSACCTDAAHDHGRRRPRRPARPTVIIQVITEPSIWRSSTRLMTSPRTSRHPGDRRHAHGPRGLRLRQPGPRRRPGKLPGLRGRQR